MRCSSYCTADSYSIDDLAKFLRSEGLDPKFYNDVIHVHKDDEDTGKDIFTFLMAALFFGEPKRKKTINLLRL